MQHLLGVGAAQPNERRAPEHLPEYGRVPQKALLLRREPVQAARDDSMNALGQRSADDSTSPCVLSMFS
jgi:hypothetical protein